MSYLYHKKWNLTIGLAKREFRLANTLDLFARGLHAHVSLFISAFFVRETTRQLSERNGERRRSILNHQQLSTTTPV